MQVCSRILMLKERKKIPKLKDRKEKRKGEGKPYQKKKKRVGDPVSSQMKYSRLHSLAVFCKSMSFLKELSKVSGYSFSFIWLVRCDCLCWYRKRVMMPMTQKVINVTTAMTPAKKRGGKRKKVSLGKSSLDKHTHWRGKKHKQIKYTNTKLLFTQR